MKEGSRKNTGSVGLATVLRLCLVMALALLAITACSDDSSDDPDETTTTTAGDGGSDYVNPGVGLQERDSQHLPDDWDEIVAAAAEEGEVVVFTNHNQTITDPIIAAFNEAFPDIEVKQVRDSVDVLPTRYVQEHEALGSSPADILESSLFETMVGENPEWFTEIASMPEDHIPTMNDLLPSASPENTPFSVSSATYVWSFVYNTDAVAESDLPSNWCDLSDAKWAGRGQMMDPRAASTYRAFQVFLYEECGEEFSAALAANEWALSDGVAPIGENVVAGAYDVGFALARAHTQSARTEGAPIAHLDLLPNRLGKTSMMFPVDPPNPNAARVFATFVLSAQAQELQCTYGNLSSFNVNVEGDCLDMPISTDAVPLDLAVTEEQEAALLDALGLQ